MTKAEKLLMLSEDFFSSISKYKSKFRKIGDGEVYEFNVYTVDFDKKKVYFAPKPGVKKDIMLDDENKKRIMTAAMKDEKGED